MATEAGKRLLEFWQLHRVMLHGVTDQNDAIPDDIAAIETEAVAAERARIAEAVQGLPSGVGRVGSRSVSVVDRAAVLAIIEASDPA